MFTRRYRYRFGDIDHAGIAYYPALMHYCHVAFEDFWADDIGTPYPVLMKEHNLGFPTVRLNATFVAPIRYGDDPDITVCPLRVGNTSAEFGFWFHVGATECLRMHKLTVAVTMDGMEKRVVPSPWRELLSERLLAADSPLRSGL